MNQVHDFATRVKSGEIASNPETTLFFLAGGLNDGRRETAITSGAVRSNTDRSQIMASSALCALVLREFATISLVLRFHLGEKLNELG